MGTTVSVRPITETEQFDGVSKNTKPDYVDRMDSESSTSYRRHVFRPKVRRGSSNITLVIEEVIDEGEQCSPPGSDTIASDVDSQKEYLNIPNECSDDDE